MWLEGPVTIVASQASTGLSDTAYIVPSLSQLANATSFKACFDEYRLTEVQYEIQATGLNNGVTKFVLDDADATVPTATWAKSRIGKLLSNNSCSPNSHAIMRFRSQDITDLQWYSTNSNPTYTPVALKIYTSAADYGTSTSVNLFVIKWKGKFEFRGLGANQ